MTPMDSRPLPTSVFAIAGAMCKTSTVVRYQQQFQRDVSNLTFVHIFNCSFSISGSSVYNFQMPCHRKYSTLAVFVPTYQKQQTDDII